MPFLFVAMILGLIQGLGEFLPISSSGHLILAQAFFGLKEPELAFDLILHLGTLTAVFIFYRRTFISLFWEMRFLPGALINPKRLVALYKSRPDFRFGLLIVVGSIPTAMVGFAFKGLVTTYLSSVLPVALALLVTGFLLKFASQEKLGAASGGHLTIFHALIIGFVQGVAIVPGFSRSGFTICTGLLLGLSRETAARFSFILSVPAIVGASLLEVRGGIDSQFSGPEFFIGFGVAAATGYLALRFLTMLLQKDNFGVFAWWCWGVGLLALGTYFLGNF
ncbi:MAG: undecaprenyl-diphosphate phosphatase [Candidatus Adiutrix sp.]